MAMAVAMSKHVRCACVCTTIVGRPVEIRLGDNYYSLHSELLVIEMDVSRCILVLDTSIPETSNSERREYMIMQSNMTMMKRVIINETMESCMAIYLGMAMEMP